MKKMNEEFKGYSKYSQNEFKRIWNNGTIVVDTNIILNFYRYSNKTREELYKILDDLKERLWIPYQVAYEYFSNKKNVIESANGLFKELNQKVEQSFGDLESYINSKAAKKLECKRLILEKLEETKKNIYKFINDEEDSKKKNANEEKIEKLIFNLFDNKMGDKIIGSEYEKIKEEGLRRVKNKLPPGYKDSDKEENGDYYIFYSMIKYAKENKTDIIFVTDDTKDDWFIRIMGEKKGGDYRLLNEFFKETGQLLLVYSSDGFLKAYQENLNKTKKIDENVLEELVNTRKLESDRLVNYIYNKNKFTNFIRALEEEFVDKKQILEYKRKLNNEIHNLGNEELKEDLNLLNYAFDTKNKVLKKFITRNIINKLDDKNYSNEKTILNILNEIEDFICYKDNDLQISIEFLKIKILELLNLIEKIVEDEEKKLFIITKLNELNNFILYEEMNESESENEKKVILETRTKALINFIREQVLYNFGINSFRIKYHNR